MTTKTALAVDDQCMVLTLIISVLAVEALGLLFLVCLCRAAAKPTPEPVELASELFDFDLRSAA